MCDFRYIIWSLVNRYHTQYMLCHVHYPTWCWSRTIWSCASSWSLATIASRCSVSPTSSPILFAIWGETWRGCHYETEKDEDVMMIMIGQYQRTHHNDQSMKKERDLMTQPERSGLWAECSEQCGSQEAWTGRSLLCCNLPCSPGWHLDNHGDDDKCYWWW